MDFLVRKGLRARLRWERCWVQPRTKALNNTSEGMSVELRSRMETTLGWARKSTRH